MLVNGFNPGRFLPSSVSPAFGNRQPIVENTFNRPTTNFEPQSTLDRAPQFNMPQFQPQGMFRPITDSFANWGNNIRNGFNNGISGLNNLATAGPAQGVGYNQPIQVPQQIQRLNVPPATRPTVGQIFNNIGQGAKQGIQDFATLAQKHGPMMLTAAAGMAGAGAVCPFMGGAMAATGGALLAQKQGQQAA